MSIAVLYESDEWSSYALNDYIQKLGMPSFMVNTEKAIDFEALFACRLVVNRVFASAQFRGHKQSLQRMPQIIEALKRQSIPMCNPYNAHFYEISKERATKALMRHQFQVPKIFGTFTKDTFDILDVVYPLIIKPDCGGRTNCTYIIHNSEEFTQAAAQLPNITMIAQEYIEPVFGYLTRIEVIDSACQLILKRSIADNGLSAYRLGSTYARYENCADEIKNAAVDAMKLLEIETGSMDIIENETGYYIIDVNSVSNASEDNTEAFNFNIMLKTAEYIAKKFKDME